MQQLHYFESILVFVFLLLGIKDAIVYIKRLDKTAESERRDF